MYNVLHDDLAKPNALQINLHWVYWLHLYWVHWYWVLTGIGYTGKVNSLSQVQTQDKSIFNVESLWPCLNVSKPQTQTLKSLLEFWQQLSLFSGQFQCQSKLLSKFQKGFTLDSKEVIGERFTVCGVLWSFARLFHYTATPPIGKPFKKLRKGPLPINIMRETYWHWERGT